MDVQRQMKVDFVNAGTLMAGRLRRPKRLSKSDTPTALEKLLLLAVYAGQAEQ